MKRLILIAQISALVVAVSCAPYKDHTAQTDIVKRKVVDAALTDMVADGVVVGVSALVFENGREAYFGSAGFADRETRRQVAREDIAQIYSMTKPVTGVALMTLYEDGLFDLDAPMATYVPELSGLEVFVGMGEDGTILTEPVRRPPTVRDFMRHTAGLIGGADESPLGQIYARVDATRWQNSLSELATDLGTVPLLYHPGEKWLYSTAVDIQALMVERLSGVPFDEYVQREILGPLGMTDTAYLVPAEKQARMIAVYQHDEDRQHTRIANDLAHAFNLSRWPLTPGSFGLTSTLDDYGKFACMLLNDGELDSVRILAPETVELMRTNTLSPTITDRSWLPSKGQVGFGINFAVRTGAPINDDEMYGEVGEFFWDGYASTLFWVDPENDITAIFFTQSIPFNGEAHRRFRDAVYGVRNLGIAD